MYSVFGWTWAEEAPRVAEVLAAFPPELQLRCKTDIRKSANPPVLEHHELKFQVDWRNDPLKQTEAFAKIIENELTRRRVPFLWHIEAENAEEGKMLRAAGFVRGD